MPHALRGRALVLALAHLAAVLGVRLHVAPEPGADGRGAGGRRGVRGRLRRGLRVQVDRDGRVEGGDGGLVFVLPGFRGRDQAGEGDGGLFLLLDLLLDGDGLDGLFGGG